MEYLRLTREELDEVAVTAGRSASEVIAKKHGLRMAALCAAASFLAACGVALVVAILLVGSARTDAHRQSRKEALANCRAVASVRPQANARVLVQQVMFEIASDRASHYPAALQKREIANVNKILKAGVKFAPGAYVPEHIDHLAELTGATKFYPLINCKREVAR